MEMTEQGNLGPDDFDRSSAISSISKIGVDRDIANMMLNGVQDYVIESGEDLQRFYMMRHNWMHYLVCMNFGIPFNDKHTFSDYLELNEINNPDCLKTHQYWDLIKKQTPDIIKRDSNGVVLLIDVTVRASEDNARRDKMATYLTMQIALQDCGYACEIVPIVFDSAARINQIDQVIEQLDDLKIDKGQSFVAYRQMISLILDTAKEIEKLSRRLKPTEFNIWLKFGQDQERIDYRINLTDADLRDMIDRCEYDPLGGRDPSDLLDNPLFNSLEMLPEDEKFLDDCASAVFEKYKVEFNNDVKPLLSMRDHIPDTIRRYQSLMVSQSEDGPKLKPDKKCFIFPYSTDYKPYNGHREFAKDIESIFSNIEGSDHHSRMLRSIAKQIQSMKESEDKTEYLSFIGEHDENNTHMSIDRSDTGCIRIPLSKADRAWHQSEGPGRKSLLVKGFQSDDPTIRTLTAMAAKKERDTKTAVLPWDTDISNLEEFVSDLSKLGDKSDAFNPDMSSNFEEFPVMDDMVYRSSETLSSMAAIKWLNIIQMISQEIARNATRKRKGHKFCVSLCKDKRYGIILAPGFRITSSARPIWFKIFSTTEMPDDRGGGLFPEVFNHGACWSTKWRSIDIFQTESFIRVRDAFSMSLLSYAETTNNGIDDATHLRSIIESSDIGGVMAVIMVAHNRSTSNVIQSARYLALRMMSINPDPWSLLNKDFNVPVRNKVLLFLLKRLVDFTLSMANYKIADLQGRMKSGYDEATGDVLDIDVDQPDDLPYVFCKGPGQSFSGLLCEIYFCMLFNKNQDEPASAALSILEKIVAEEAKLYDSGLPEGFETGLLDDETCIGIALEGFRSHFFSAHAVTIGAKLQARHEHNKKPMGSAVMEVIQDNKFIKSLDKYATFKASTISVERSADLRQVDPSNSYDNTVDMDNFDDFSELERIAKEYDLKPDEFEVLLKRARGEQLTQEERYLNNSMIRKISEAANPLRTLANRTKCVVNVVNLLSENMDVVTNVEYLRKHIRNMEAMIQIFKKNQIGGVREIEILMMDMRILLEYIERVPTSISKYDEREMISAKQLKGEIIKANVMKMLSESAGKEILNVNSCRDMSKWSQSFMPIIFFYTVLPYKGISSDYVRTNMAGQILMSNKRFELPAKLIELWLLNPLIKHSDKAMQDVKEEFLAQDRGSMDCTYLCKSGMGQGLEQTGSTVLHLGELSFRDELLKRVTKLVKDFCTQRGYNVDLWLRHFDAVSSDDKTTYKLMTSKFPDNLITLSIFKRVEAFSEALFCMLDSERKSVTLINLAEFNSEFTMRYNQYSPLIKFAHKSVLVPDTRSPLRSISQMYGTVRELRANGASSFLCRMAHYLNKDFIEGVFLTSDGAQNDPSLIFNCGRQFCPADLGVYPIFQPEMMDMAGLEYHNHLLLNHFSSPPQIKNLVSYMYQSSESINGTDYASVERDHLADTLPRRIHIEISVGMSANLVRARENCPMSKEDLEHALDPSNANGISILDLLGPSKTNRVASMRAASLLYTLGAKDSFKNTNGALYYARIGAMSTGKCFHVRNAESDEIDKGTILGQTYQTLVLWLKSQTQSYTDQASARSQLSFYKLYDKCNASNSVDSFKKRKPGFRLLKSRKLRTYSKTVVLKHSLSDILHYKWGGVPAQMVINSYERDWEIMRRRMPYLKESEAETLRAMNVKISGVNLYKLLLELVKTTTEKNEYSKWLIIGSSTSDLMSTSFAMRFSNSFGGLVGDDIDYMAYARKIDHGSDLSLFRYSMNCLLMDLNLTDAVKQYNCAIKFREFVGRTEHGGLDVIEKVTALGRGGTLDVQDMKRLLMAQMVLGRTENEIQDTLYRLNHSYLVWVEEQYRNADGDWEGPFDVMIKSGKSTLRMTGHGILKGLAFQFVAEKWDPFQMHGMLDSLFKIWIPDGLKGMNMSDIKARCRKVVSYDFGMLVVKSEDMRIPELRKLTAASELIPLKFATDWRAADYFFDYRQIEMQMGNVIRMFTKTRTGRSVRFAGIFNGVTPIHPAELAKLETDYGEYPVESVQILNKAGYQTNMRSLKRLDKHDLRKLMSVSRRVILADAGSSDELDRICSAYNIASRFVPDGKNEKLAEEAAIYDNLLAELASEEPNIPRPQYGDPGMPIDENDAFNTLSLDMASSLLSGDVFAENLEQLNSGFEEEAFQGAITRTHRLRPKILITQPPVSWATMGSIFEQTMILQHMRKLSGPPTIEIWVDAMMSVLYNEVRGDSMDVIMMILIKYCFENIRLVPQGLDDLFLSGDLSVEDLEDFGAQPFALNYIASTL